MLILVAHGRSDQEIADELVTSERTDRTHVSRVLRKLQLTSRTQAALAAVREGLVPPETAPPPRVKGSYRNGCPVTLAPGRSPSVPSALREVPSALREVPPSPCGRRP